MTNDTDADLVRREVERAARVFGMHDPGDAFSIGGDLLSGIRVENGRAIGISDAMTSLKKAKPNLFFDARSASTEERAARLAQIRKDHERGLDKNFHDRQIGRMKVEQAKYVARRDAQK